MIRSVVFLTLVLLVAGCANASMPSRSSIVQQPTGMAGHVVQPDASTNRLGNPGFEKPMNTGVISCASKPIATGDWQPYAQTNGTVPVEENTVVHAGKLSLEVQTPAAPEGCGGDGAYQDFLAFPVPTSYTYSYWVMPALNSENESVFYGWDHGNGGGGTAASDDVHIKPTETDVDAWGTASALPAVSYGVWHQFVLTADAVKLTATLKVDGKVLGSTPAGVADQSGPVTIWIGQESGAPNGDHFYYDSVVFDTSPHPKKATPNTAMAGAVHQMIAISGMNFSPDAAVSISGSGVTIDSTAVKSATKIVIFVDVSGTAATGARDITVTESGGTGTCTGCLTIT